MKIQLRTVGQIEPLRDVYVDWPAVPRQGDSVHIHGLDLTVRTVVWYPEGGAGESIHDAFVYVVVGNARPSYG